MASPDKKLTASEVLDLYRKTSSQITGDIISNWRYGATTITENTYHNKNQYTRSKATHQNTLMLDNVDCRNKTWISNTVTMQSGPWPWRRASAINEEVKPDKDSLFS